MEKEKARDDFTWFGSNGENLGPAHLTDGEHDSMTSEPKVHVHTDKCHFINDGKYVVLKVNDFSQMLGEVALPPWWISVEDDDCDVEHVYGEQGWRPLDSVEGYHEHLMGTDWPVADFIERLLDVVNRYAIPDATVIRDQDVFSASTLYAYSNSILSSVEVLEATGFYMDTINALRAKADFFAARAHRASQATNKKLPD